jgi:hypothetical protein
MTMKNNSLYFFIGMLMILGPGFFPADSIAQMDLLDSPETSKQYLLNISGTVMNETFTGSQALLTLMPPAPYGSNPYQIIIGGFPKKNSRNSFFWNSDHSEMTAVSNDITCDIKRTAVKRVPMYFVFLSPELLKHTGALAVRAGGEGEQMAEKVALPTLIYAMAGKLKLRIHSNSVSGTVWMKGYDRTEKAYVQYSVRIQGNRSYKLQPKQEQKK